MTGQTIIFERDVIVDYILAQASLHGDITGRGSILNDLDEAAICCIAGREIARRAFAIGAEYDVNEKDWTVYVPDGFSPRQMYEWIMSAVLGEFIPSAPVLPMPQVLPPTIQPEW